jgi:energy-coupling factor transport system substrate-specific component
MKREAVARVVRSRPFWIVMPAVVAAGLLNSLFVLFNRVVFLPLFLDSIFTACVAALFGWFPGMLAGLWTNLAMELFTGFPLIYLPFAVCGASTGLVIGLMARRGGFRTVVQALAATLLVTVSNAVLGSLVATFFYGGITGGAAVDYLAVGLLATGQSLISSTFLARIPTNLIDKAIAVFAAFFLLLEIRRWSRETVDGARPGLP